MQNHLLKLIEYWLNNHIFIFILALLTIIPVLIGLVRYILKDFKKSHTFLRIIVTALILIITIIVFFAGPYIWPSKMITAEFKDIATFKDGEPVNAYNVIWSTYNDSRYRGQSTVWYEVIKREGKGGDHFMRIHFILKRNRIIDTKPAYCGVYTEFTDPPGIPKDLSKFEGLSIEYKGEIESSINKITTPNIIKVSLTLAPTGIKKRAYPWIPLDTQKLTDKKFMYQNLPFKDFKPAGWVNTPVAGTFLLDTKNIFRIGINIQENDKISEKDLAKDTLIQGHFDFDSLELM